jgi:DNA-binding response OmpR family regulator
VPSPHQIRILSISDDAMVRSTRELVLRRDGYEIVSIGSNELLSVPVIRSFDVAVLCHSVPPERAMGVIDRLRRYKPEIRVLRVNARAPRVEPCYDVDSEVLAGPAALLHAVKELLDRNAGPGVRRGPLSEGQDEYCGPFPAVGWNPRPLQRM